MISSSDYFTALGLPHPGFVPPLLREFLDRLGRPVDRDTLKPVDPFAPDEVFLSACWPWRKTINSYGYGVFHIPGNGRIAAHRFSCALKNSEGIVAGLKEIQGRV